MIVLKNVLIPHGEQWIKRDVIIQRGVYGEISESIDERPLKDARIIQGEERYLLPAFIDPHVHVREPGFDYKEDWMTCSRAALKGGASSIFDMPNNKIPVVDYPGVKEKSEIANKKSYVNFGLYAALTDNNIDELKSTGMQGAVCGIKIYLARTTGNITVTSGSALLNVFNQPKPVLVHTGGIEGLKKVLFFYEKASKHFSVVPVLYVCHVSTGEEVALLRKWKEKLPSILAEATPHHLFLNKEEYTGLKGVLPPLSTKKDVEALWEGVKDGTIDLLGTDHAPHTVEEKRGRVPPSGFPGLETAFPLILNAFKDRRLSLNSLLRMTSGNAGKLFKMGIGDGVVKGEKADCTLVEEGVFRAGEDGYETKCGWSPFHGWNLGFKPVLTVVNGFISYENGKFYRNPVKNLCR